MKNELRRLIAFVFGFLFAASPAFAAGRTVTVFAAVSLTDVLQQIGKNYEAQTNDRVVFSFASSSALARQIAASSGADIFLSADTKWMDFLAGKNLIVPSTRKALLGNSLVLVAPASSTADIAIGQNFPLLAALHGGRLAIAEPESVPAGIYGKAALEKLGVWESVAGRLAPAEDVRVALAYVARGEVPLGIVYRTDAIAEPKVRIAATFPESSHPPIVYPVALLKGADPAAAPLLTYLESNAARAVFTKAGFTVLGASK